METVLYTAYMLGFSSAAYLFIWQFSEWRKFLKEKKEKRNEDFNYDMSDDLNEKVFGDLL